MSNSFLCKYNANSKNSDISYRVDIKHKRVYVPKKYMLKKIDISNKGEIVVLPKNSKGGVVVNKQGFISVAKLPSNEFMELASLINKK